MCFILSAWQEQNSGCVDGEEEAEKLKEKDEREWNGVVVHIDRMLIRATLNFRVETKPMLMFNLE